MQSGMKSILAELKKNPNISVVAVAIEERVHFTMGGIEFKAGIFIAPREGTEYNLGEILIPWEEETHTLEELCQKPVYIGGEPNPFRFSYFPKESGLCSFYFREVVGKGTFTTTASIAHIDDEPWIPYDQVAGKEFTSSAQWDLIREVHVHFCASANKAQEWRQGNLGLRFLRNGARLIPVQE